MIYGFLPCRFTMHLASYVYENLYRFDEQNFESDLIVRCVLMAPLNPFA